MAKLLRRERCRRARTRRRGAGATSSVSSVQLSATTTSRCRRAAAADRRQRGGDAARLVCAAPARTAAPGSRGRATRRARSAAALDRHHSWAARRRRKGDGETSVTGAMLLLLALLLLGRARRRRRRIVLRSVFGVAVRHLPGAPRRWYRLFRSWGALFVLAVSASRRPWLSVLPLRHGERPPDGGPEPERTGAGTARRRALPRVSSLSSTTSATSASQHHSHHRPRVRHSVAAVNMLGSPDALFASPPPDLGCRQTRRLDLDGGDLVARGASCEARLRRLPHARRRQAAASPVAACRSSAPPFRPTSRPIANGLGGWAISPSSAPSASASTPGARALPGMRRFDTRAHRGARIVAYYAALRPCRARSRVDVPARQTDAAADMPSAVDL